MFFEPEEFDSEFIDKLKNDLDNENIFVTEDLIQRTLSAAKESDNENQKNVAIRKKIGMKVWVRRIACAAACVLFLLIINNEGILLPMNAKKSDMDRSSTSSANESAMLSENKSLAGSIEYGESDDGAGKEDALMDSGTKESLTTEGGEDVDNSNLSNSDLIVGATVSGNLEQEKKEDSNQSSSDAESEEFSLNPTFGSSGETSLTSGDTILQKDGVSSNGYTLFAGMTLLDIIDEEQKKDADPSIARYIPLHENVEEEKAVITALDAKVEGLIKESAEITSEIPWDYKVFVQSSKNREIRYYFISQSGYLALGEYEAGKKVNELNYQVEDINVLIKVLEDSF